VRGAAALVVLTALRVAHAQDVIGETVPYRVKHRDSLELLAAEFYGDRTKAVFIMVANKLAHARPLRPGERLRIPVSREVASSPGDTFESLAGVFLGSTRRGVFLADFNGMSTDDGLPAGTVITIPLTIVHTAAAAESLADIARAYFGDGKKAELLRRYNLLERSTVERNEQVVVPAYHVRLTAQRMPPLDAESRARREHRREALIKAARALPAARLAWKDGDFPAIKEVLEPLEPDLDYLDTREAVEVGVLLGAAQVAFDETEPALATFKRVLDRRPSHVLKRYGCSPKVLEVWQQAGGPIE
jgi:hypothetical protein